MCTAGRCVCRPGYRDCGDGICRNLKTDPSDTAIVRAIINLGHSLRLGVIAEGVETVEQVTQLIAEGCDEIQGHYYSQPVAAADLQALVRRMNAAQQQAG